MNKINPKLIIGLGNPGKESENTRHNTGFLFVDELAKYLKAPDFAHKKNLKAEISITNYQLQTTNYKLFLAKPQTFMNKSGDAVLALSKFYKIKPENILVVHDDIDILWSNFKFSFGRSSAGHKGVESIIKTLKTKNFWRLRLGIQPAFAKATAGKPTPKKHISADKIILKKFTPAELKILNQTIKKIIPTLSPNL